jgi:hypothetical protein
MTIPADIPTGPIEDEPILPVDADGLEILGDALAANGVALGAYDDRIFHWLVTNWGPAYPYVVASWLRRAYEAGKRSTS